LPFLTSPPPLLISYTHLNLGNMHENVQMFCDCFLWLVINTTFIPTWKIPTNQPNKILQPIFTTKKMCTKTHWFDMFWNAKLYWKWKGASILWHNSIYIFWNWFVLLNCIMQTLKKPSQLLFLHVTFLL